MKDEDIEILEDLPQNNDNRNYESIPRVEQYSSEEQPQQTFSDPVNYQQQNDNSSQDVFEQLISEPVVAEKPTEIKDNNDYVAYQNEPYDQSIPVNQVNDANNDLIQSNSEQDLTITAVYPNGFVVPDQEETEENVIQPKKKKSNDLYLVIIVAILAITLVVMLVIFYL